MPDLQTFIVTFGCVGIRNGYVRIEAYDEEIARSWLAREYGRCWSNIYDQLHWDQLSHEKKAEYWPLGELGSDKLFYDRPLKAL